MRLTRSIRAQRFILFATIAGSSMAFVDGTVVNVALPAIERDFHTGLAGEQLIVLSYSPSPRCTSSAARSATVTAEGASSSPARSASRSRRCSAGRRRASRC